MARLTHAPKSSNADDNISEERLAVLERRRLALDKMLRLREKAIAEGMVLKSEEEIRQEVAHRRGYSD